MLTNKLTRCVGNWQSMLRLDKLKLLRNNNALTKNTT